MYQSEMDVKAINDIAQILKSSADLEIMLENFENPFCEENLCSHRRAWFSFAESVEFSLLAWEQRKPFFSTKQDYPVIDVAKILCTLTETTNNQIYSLVPEKNEKSEQEFDLSKIDKNFSKLRITPFLFFDRKDGDRFNRVWIDLELKSPNSTAVTDSIVVTGGEGVATRPEDNRHLSGIIVAGQTTSKLDARFSVVNAKDENEIDKDSWTHFFKYYYLTDFNDTIKEKPTINKEYRLQCEVHP